MSAIEIVLRILIWIVACTIGYFLFNGLVVSVIDEYNARKAARLKVVLDNGAFAPERAHSADAGLDIKSPVDKVIPSGGSAVIDTGFHISIPQGYYGELRGRSGLHVKHDIVCFGGTIDSGFENSILVKLYNLGKSDYQIHAGDRIVQLVIMPCELPTLEFVSSFDGNSERGQNGIGSTGR